MGREKTVKTWRWEGNDIHIETTDGERVLLKDAYPFPKRTTIHRDEKGNVVMTETTILVENPRVQAEEDTECLDCAGRIPKGSFAIRTPFGLMHDYCVEESGKAHREALEKAGY